MQKRHTADRAYPFHDMQSVLGKGDFNAPHGAHGFNIIGMHEIVSGKRGGLQTGLRKFVLLERVPANDAEMGAFNAFRQSLNVAAVKLPCSVHYGPRCCGVSFSPCALQPPSPVSWTHAQSDPGDMAASSSSPAAAARSSVMGESPLKPSGEQTPGAPSTYQTTRHV